MSWWIVNYIPSWVLLTGLIVLIAGGAVLLQRHVRRRFPVLKGDAHNDATKFTYGFIGVCLCLLHRIRRLLHVGQNNAADGNARAEGAAAAQMARDAVVFDMADKDRIRQSLMMNMPPSLKRRCGIVDHQMPTPPWPAYIRPTTA